MMNKKHSESVAAAVIAMAASEDRSMLKRFFILCFLHDLLPWEEDQPRLTPSCLQAKLQQMGIERELHSVQRDMKYLVDVAWVETEGQRPRRYRRYYSESLVYRLMGKRVTGKPDWSSEIIVDWREDRSSI